MDEFRIEPTLADNPYRDAEQLKTKRRKKDEHGEAGQNTSDQQDVVTLSGEQKGDNASTADFYTPAPPPEEQD